MSVPIFTTIDLAQAIGGRLGLPVSDLRLLPIGADPSALAWTATNAKGMQVSGVVRLRSSVGEDGKSIVIEPEVEVDEAEPVQT